MIRSRTTLITSLLISLFGIAACNKTVMTATPDSLNSPTVPVLIPMTAQLSGATEVPPNKSTGKGMVDANFNKQSNVLTWTITYSGLTGPATAAHFHGPAGLGVNAPPSVPLSGSLDSPIKGTATLTAAQVSDLTAGNWYLNVHTAANPGGEIRGQVMAKP